MTPTLDPVVAEPVVAEKPKRQMTAAQLESLAKAREKAAEVRRAKAAAKKAAVENPPDLAPVFHGEDPPTVDAPVKPTAPEETVVPAEEAVVPPEQDSESDDDGFEAEVQRRVKAIREKSKLKKAKKRDKKKRYVIEESESEDEEGEILVVRKKPKPTLPNKSPLRHPHPIQQFRQFHGMHPGSSFNRF